MSIKEIEQAKINAVKEYLSRYIPAMENMKALAELNVHISEDLTNPSIGGKGYNVGSSGKQISGGAAAPVIRSCSTDQYIKQQADRNQAVMKEVSDAIALLEVGRSKTLIEFKFLMGYPWRYIDKKMEVCKDTRYKIYREGMLRLYDLMVEHGMLNETA